MKAAVIWCAAACAVAVRAQAPAATAGDFGPPTADPLTVSGTWTCADQATFDFGPRRVIFAPGAAVAVQSATFLAGAFEISAGATVTASTRATFSATGAGGATGDLYVAGVLKADGSGPGRLVEATAAGRLRILGSGRCSAVGTAPTADGGTVFLTASGDVELDGAATSVDASGGALGAGGLVVAHSLAGDVRATRGVVVRGTAGGGDVQVFAAADAELADVDLAGGTAPGAFLGGDGGTLTVTCGGDLALNGTIDAGVEPPPAPVVASGGAVTLAAGGAAVCAGAVRLEGGAFSSAGAFSAVVGGDFVWALGASLNASNAGEDGLPGALAVAAGGDLRWFGSATLDAGPSAFAPGGAATLRAMGAVELYGGLILRGTTPGAAELRSDGASVVVLATGIVDASSFVVDGVGGQVTLDAAEDATVWGVLDASGATDHTGGGMIDVVAADSVRIAGSAVVRLGGHDGGHLMLDGCRVVVDPGAVLDGDGFHHGGHLEAVCGDAAQIGGAWSAQPGGHVDVMTRLPAPYSVVAVAPTAAGTVMIMDDPWMPPCLARGRASFEAAQTQIAAGGTAAVELVGAPNAPVVALVALDAAAVPLGPYGFAEVDPFTAVRLADFGLFGPPLPASATGGDGRWTFSAQVPDAPFFAGLTLRFAAVVFDAAARNGLFDQPPAVEIAVQ